jgi:hypothetical protein
MIAASRLVRSPHQGAGLAGWQGTISAGFPCVVRRSIKSNFGFRLADLRFAECDGGSDLDGRALDSSMRLVARGRLTGVSPTKPPRP